jgi:carbonic anhydrase
MHEFTHLARNDGWHSSDPNNFMFWQVVHHPACGMSDAQVAMVRDRKINTLEKRLDKLRGELYSLWDYRAEARDHLRRAKKKCHQRVSKSCKRQIARYRRLDRRVSRRTKTVGREIASVKTQLTGLKASRWG